MVEIMDSIKTTFGATKVLEEKSKQMDEILTVIASISSQTNLLALNASMEAARAGESGKLWKRYGSLQNTASSL